MADSNPSNILIERNYHLCKSHPKFEPNFKLRFTAADNKLLNNPLLNLLFENETQLEKARDEFIIDVANVVDPQIIAQANK